MQNLMQFCSTYIVESMLHCILFLHIARLIINSLQLQGNSLSHCHCIDSRGPQAGRAAKLLCSRYCKSPLKPRHCRAPPACDSVPSILTVPTNIQGILVI